MSFLAPHGTPCEFISKVCAIGHPQNIVLGLCAEVKEASQKIATLSSDQVVVLRGRWLGKYVAAARESKGDNEKILATMPTGMRAVLKSNRLLLLKKILHVSCLR